MTAVADSSIRRDHERRDGGTVTPETLLRDASFILDRCGVVRSPSWVRRTVRDYCDRVAHTGFPFGRWLLTRVQLNAEQRRRAEQDPAVAKILSYADPTGETAVANVMRAGR
ncbi:MAG: hypothetical protein PSX37_05340 [bacterium]|nr:hypothetical protein [bacterium]